MLVKKIDNDWKPSEKPDLKAGEVIEMTDPRGLILEGKAVAVTKEGATISAYELYGVIIRSERKEFEEYLKFKKQQDLGKQLEKENKELKTATAEVTKGESLTAAEVIAKQTGKTQEEVEVEIKKKAYIPKSQKLAEL